MKPVRVAINVRVNVGIVETCVTLNVRDNVGTVAWCEM